MDLIGFAAVLATLAVIAGALLVGRNLFVSARWSRPVRLLSDPVPDEWEAIARRRVPLVGKLDPEDFTRLMKLVQVFVNDKAFEGAGGLEMTDEIRVTIAAQACLLILWLDVGLYPALRTVIVYPSAVTPRYARSFSHSGGIEDESPTAVLGQSWQQGTVILAWDSTLRGAFDPRDGKNLVFHEFAHQLDQEADPADGMPVGLRLSSVKPWAEVIERRFRQLRKAARKGRDTVMDPYGATNHAEFFAVATETFFEKPKQLREHRPDLYELLVDFYGVDPAIGLRRRNPTGPSP